MDKDLLIPIGLMGVLIAGVVVFLTFDSHRIRINSLEKAQRESDMEKNIREKIALEAKEVN